MSKKYLFFESIKPPVRKKKKVKNPNILTAEEAGELLGVTSVTIRTWTKEGLLSWLHKPGRYQYDRSYIESLAAKKRDEI